MVFEAHAAEQLARNCIDITERWAERVMVETRGVPHGVGMLQYSGHMPGVLCHVSAFVQDDGYPLAEQAEVRDAVTTLTRLRRQAGCGAEQLVSEFELLARVLDGACLEWIRAYNGSPDAESVLRVAGRLNRAPLLLSQLAVAAYRAEERGDETDGEDRVREFAEVLAHELKTPLNAAAVSVQLLEYAGGARTAEAKRLTALIRRNLERADRALRNVRTTALEEPLGGGATKQPFDQVLASVLAELHDELNAANVRLEIEEPIPTMRVSAAHVRIVLSNLIRNAVKYRDPARQPTVRLQFRRRAADGTWWVDVTDNGIGIPPEHHDDVFRRRFRGTSMEDGSGVGLLIVRREVERMGGDVEFRADAGATTFSFTLPEPSR